MTPRDQKQSATTSPKETRQYLVWDRDSEDEIVDHVTQSLFAAADKSDMDPLLGKKKKKDKDKKDKKKKNSKDKKKKNAKKNRKNKKVSSSSSSSKSSASSGSSEDSSKSSSSSASAEAGSCLLVCWKGKGCEIAKENLSFLVLFHDNPNSN